MIKIDFDGRMTPDQIKEALDGHEYDRYQRNLDYYYGQNQTILERKQNIKEAPNWIIAVPYARKIIKTVVGYMYKPGLITYSSENENYLDTLIDVFDANQEPTKTSLIGAQSSIQGQGYEIHYTVNDGGKIIPRFSRIPVTHGIPIYDFQIEPQLHAFIYYYTRGNVQDIYVYYSDVKVFYQRGKNESEGLPKEVNTEPHEYGDVPVAVYKNNDETIGDFEPVIGLVDAYDGIMSDCMNEVDRFASAYMVLKGIGTLDDENKRDLKERRTFEIDSEGAVEILTKDIPAEYFQFITEHVRKEIHKQSHVPNFLEESTGGEISGVAIDKLLYDFEFIAATKEALFKEGLERRIELVNTILRKANTKNIGDEWDIDIHFERNKPQNMKENAEIVNQLIGIVSKETLINYFVPFVDDPVAELEKVEEEGDTLGDIDDNREASMEPAAED